MRNSTEKNEMPLPDEDETQIEKLIESLPLKEPSANCDARVIACLNPDRLLASDEPAVSGNTDVGVSLVHKDTDSRTNASRTGDRRKPSRQIIYWAVSTAAALLVGFMLGTLVNRETPKQSGNDNLTSSPQMLAGFELTDNVKIVEGKSKTLIVDDRIQMQNNVPVRKLETVTHKKVRVKNSKDQPEKEMDIPIRKTFFTLAETI